MGLEGDAGTGKTTVLKEIVRGIERSGQTPFACAPSSSATEVLRKELTPEADTLQQLLVNPALQAKVTGRTIIVDEAGLISTRQMHALFELAQQNQNRLLLVGDIKQHASVEAGDAFRALKKFAGIDIATLKTIRRQVDPGYRKVVTLLAQRKPYEAFTQLERLGAVRQIREPGMLYAQAAQDYVATLKKGQSCLAISPVWSDIHQFNEVARSLLKEEGLLQNEEKILTAFAPFQWTKAERKDARNYQTGDVLQFHRQSAVFEKGESVRFVERLERRIVVERTNGERLAFHPGQITGFDAGLNKEVPVAVGEKLLIRSNHTPARLQNGDIVEVAKLEKDGSIRLKDGRIMPTTFRQFAHGYATTSHASQGKTVDRAIVLLSDEAIRAANLRQAYVSNSRFRLTQALYVTDRKAAQEAMSTPAERELAMELAAKEAERWSYMEELIEMEGAFEATGQRQAIDPSLKQGVTHGP